MIEHIQKGLKHVVKGENLQYYCILIPAVNNLI